MSPRIESSSLSRHYDRRFLGLCLGMMGVQTLVGGLGFALHLRSSLEGVSESLWENLIFGAPPFAPLLFANLAGLASIGLWHVRRA